MANKVLICVFGAARCYCKQKKMDANLQFWPKIGDRVSYSGAVLGKKGKTSQFSVKEIKEEYPCTYYIIEDIKTYKQIRAFRPELSKANVVDEISTRFLRLITVNECFVLAGAVLTAQIYTQNIVFPTQKVLKSSTKQEKNR